MQWSAPWTAECVPLTSYNVTVKRTDSGEVVSSSSQSPRDAHMQDMIVPEPAVHYTVIISAINGVGHTNCEVDFMSANEISKYNHTTSSTDMILRRTTTNCMMNRRCNTSCPFILGPDDFSLELTVISTVQAVIVLIVSESPA